MQAIFIIYLVLMILGILVKLFLNIMFLRDKSVIKKAALEDVLNKILMLMLIYSILMMQLIAISVEGMLEATLNYMVVILSFIAIIYLINEIRFMVKQKAYVKVNYKLNKADIIKADTSDILIIKGENIYIKKECFAEFLVNVKNLNINKKLLKKAIIKQILFVLLILLVLIIGIALPEIMLKL